MAVACVVASVWGLSPVVVAFAVPLLPRPGVGAELVVTVASARRCLGLPGHRRGSDESGQEYRSRGDRQHRRPMEAEPHVVPSPRGRTTDAATAGRSRIRAAVSWGLPWGNFRRSTSFGRSRRTRPNRLASRRRQRRSASQAALPLPLAAPAAHYAWRRRVGIGGTRQAQPTGRSSRTPDSRSAAAWSAKSQPRPMEQIQRYAPGTHPTGGYGSAAGTSGHHRLGATAGHP